MGKSTRGRRATRQTKHTILIVTNGERTEKAYLDEVKRLASKPGLSIKVEFINGDGNNIVKKLRSPHGDTSAYDEVWIVIDADGKDRSDFVAQCGKLSGKQIWRGIVSVPCFEVWLTAHYEPVQNYVDQADAQKHYKQLIPAGTNPKHLPEDFPWEGMNDAIERCHLPGAEESAASIKSLSPQAQPCPN